MLIEKTHLSAGDVISLKLLNGPDLIGRLHADFNVGDKIVSIRKPLEAHMVRDQESLGLAFAPFSLIAKDDHVFHIPASSLMVDPFLARDEVKTSYVRQTSSLAL